MGEKTKTKKEKVEYLKPKKKTSNLVLQIIFTIVFTGVLLEVVINKIDWRLSEVLLLIIPVSVIYYFVVGYFLEGKNKKYTDAKDMKMYFSKEDNYKVIRALMDKENIKKEDLKHMYDQCISSEQFYEGTIWTIGSIFITASFSIIAVAFSSDLIEQFLGILIATGIYFVFLVIFHRFRLSIRLFRNVTRILEHELDYFAFRYVYDLEFEKYGLVTRIWTVLLCIFLILINLTIIFI